MAFSLGHNGHHQAISQKLKKAVNIVWSRQFIWDPIYIYVNIQVGARNVIPLIVHVTYFYYYKNIW